MNKRALRVGLCALVAAVSSACSSTKGPSDAESSASPADTAAATAEPSSQALGEVPKKKFKLAKLQIDDGDGDAKNIPESSGGSDPKPIEAASAAPTTSPTQSPNPPPPNWTRTEPGKPATDAKHGPNRVGAAQSSSGAGQMSRENIETTLGNSEGSFGQCADTSSTFSARLVVAPNGSVTEARVTQSVPDDPRLRDCLTEALRRLSFPPTNAPVPLSFSLAIEPS